MGGVIGVYHRPHHPDGPPVGVGEGGKQRIGEVRAPLPVRVGGPAKEGYEYDRHGVANLFLAFEPAAGRRVVEVTERRPAADFARFLKHLLDVVYPSARRLVRVTDNLNTPGTGSRYEGFAPAAARRLAERIEWHDPPKHGSWRNRAETGLSVRARPGPDRRIPDRDTRTREVAAWADTRNAAGAKADGPLTTADARVKRKKLYPTIQVH